ncbi:MAG: hypothetical protein U9R75_07910, partial [Candidatus Thermoplasmatota archaeon]|nr:hypothetical protein [Candidatus Thermoplasmatota archaeon]
PYLSAISHADIVFPSYYLGANLAESYYSGSQLASWMGTMIGDPKCAPFSDLRSDPRIADDPILYWIDDDGTPRVRCQVQNDGSVDLSDVPVEIMVDGRPPIEIKVDIAAMSTTGINLTVEGGVHEINITIDPDRESRDRNESNNYHSERVSVNHVPRVSMYKVVPPASDNRTFSRTIVVDVEDPDEIASPGGVDLTFTAPDGSIFSPVFSNRTISSGTTSLNYVWAIPWNAPLGRYDALCEYRDSNGSMDRVHLDPLFHVRNNLPELFGEVSTNEMARGGNFTVDLSWLDPDTPDGSLTVKIEVSGSVEGEIEPISINRTLNSAQYTYDLDPDVCSEQISITARVIDRDGAYDAWDAEISTLNGVPDGMILGVGADITRSESTIFSVYYVDPEGQPSREASIGLWGPKGASSEIEAVSFDLDLLPMEEYELLIHGVELEIGSYDLLFNFMDDEYSHGSVRYENALNVTNAPPSIENVSLFVLSSQMEQGSGIERSGTVTVSVIVDDPDFPGWGMDLCGSIEGENGFRRGDLEFHKIGQFEFEIDLRTDQDWPVNEPFSLELFLTDDQGSEDTLYVPGIFFLYTEPPVMVDMAVDLDGTMNVTITVSFSQGPGGSLPEKVVIVLTDENGTLLEEELITCSGGFLWELTARVYSVPIGISIMVIDDSGTVSYWNDTLSIEDPRLTVGPIGSNEPEGSPGGMVLWIFMISLFVLLIIAGVLIFFVISRRRSGQDHAVNPPGMSSSLMGHEGQAGLSQVAVPGLPAPYPRSVSAEPVASGPAPLFNSEKK